MGIYGAVYNSFLKEDFLAESPFWATLAVLLRKLDHFGPDDVLLVDAIRSDAPPGTLVRLDGDEVAPAVRDRLSVHQIGVADLLDALHLLDAWPARMELVGLVPERVELGLGFSPCVEAALPALEGAVVAAIRGRGHPLRTRNPHADPADPLDGRRAARSLGL